MSAVEAIEPEFPSPFLPGTHIQYAWDSTSLGWFKQCPRLYQYAMLEGWEPKGTKDDLYFGIEYHQALYDYDLERASDIDHDDAVHDVIRALLTRTYGWQTENKYKNRPNLIRTVIWYLDHFKDDPAKTVILDNGAPACELSFRFELDFGPQFELDFGPQAGSGELDVGIPYQPYLLCGYLDRVVEFQGDRYGMDRKTTKTTPGAYFFDQFAPNNQMTLYIIALQIIFESPIKGMIIDTAQVPAEVDRVKADVFHRGFTYRTQENIDEWIKDLEIHLASAEACATANYWPMNDTACDKYGGCAFRSVCSKAPGVRDMFLKSDFQRRDEQWNPLKPR